MDANGTLAALCVGGMNLLTFLVFALDKRLAKKHTRRIPEAVLLTLSWLGGSVGAMAAMTAFHHKTDAKAHPAFDWGIPLAFLAQLVLGFWLTWEL